MNDKITDVKHHEYDDDPNPDVGGNLMWWVIFTITLLWIITHW